MLIELAKRAKAVALNFSLNDAAAACFAGFVHFS
jgi:hypothetical protein